MKGEFEVGETKVVSGRVTTDKFSGNLVMSSPDVVAPLADLDKVGRAPVHEAAGCFRTGLAANGNRRRKRAYQALIVRAYRQDSGWS